MKKENKSKDIMKRFIQESKDTVSLLAMTALATYGVAVIKIDENLEVTDITLDHLKDKK